MRILYSSTVIASPDPAEGRMGPDGLQWSGSPILDVVQLFRAANATVYARGDGAEEVAFGVWVGPFASEAEVLAFCALHRSSLPVQADLELIDDAGTVAVLLADAAREVRIGTVNGLSVRVDYKFTGSLFTSESVPPSPSDTANVKSQVVDLTASEESKAVAFDLPFTAVPRFVRGEISAPDGGTAFFAIPRESTRLAAGITFDFTAPVPGAGYKLLVLAVL